MSRRFRICMTKGRRGRVAEVDPRFEICCNADSVLRKNNTFFYFWSDRLGINRTWALILGLHGGIYGLSATYLRICVQIHVRTLWISLTFPSHKFGKERYAFYHVKLYCFAEKNKVRQKYPNFITLTNWVVGLCNQWQIKSNIFKEGSGHPNFMNPFEYGKSFLDMSHFRMFQKVESGWGPIFKVVLEY